MKPSIGRIVHYYDDKSDDPIPACITGVGENGCDLTLLIAGAPGVYNVPESTNGQPEVLRWNWPPRVE